MNLETRFYKHMEHLLSFSEDTKLVLAVSGGVDSMVLLQLFLTLRKNHHFDLCVVHVNHQLRKESMAEERMVKGYCEIHHVPLYIEQWDKADHPKTGIEEAARNFRYRFFKKILDKEEAHALLTAHHRDDQSETILMRFVRGNTLQGLTGMNASNPFGDGVLLRPLLPFTKSELYTYAHDMHVPFMEDVSNFETEFTRNRYRNHILPLLKTENPQFDRQLITFAEEIRDVLTVIEPVIDQAVSDLFEEHAEGIKWNRGKYLSFAPALQRLILQRALDQVYYTEPIQPGRDLLSVIHMWIGESGSNSSLDLPDGWIIRREYDDIHLTRKTEDSVSEYIEKKLELNQWTLLPEGTRIGLFEKEKTGSSKKNKQVLFFSSEQIKLPLLVRSPQPGDRIQLQGGGTKKIARVFIDKKIPRGLRKKAYVIVDAEGEVLWVPGFKDSALSIKAETDTIQYILVYEPVDESESN